MLLFPSSLSLRRPLLESQVGLVRDLLDKVSAAISSRQKGWLPLVTQREQNPGAARASERNGPVGKLP